MPSSPMRTLQSNEQDGQLGQPPVIGMRSACNSSLRHQRVRSDAQRQQSGPAAAVGVEARGSHRKAPPSGTRNRVRRAIQPIVRHPWRRTAPSESQEVLRRGATETGFGAPRPKAQSGAHSKKPRVVRGSVRLLGPLGRLEGLVLAEREGFEPSIRCRIHDFQSCAFDHSATSP
jgi:hypothetical protein